MNFEFIEDIGKGAFGLVKKAKLIPSNKIVAIKIQNIKQQINYFNERLGNYDEAKIYVFKQIKIEDELLKLTEKLIFKQNSKDETEHYSIMKYIDGIHINKIFQSLTFNNKIKCFIDIVLQVSFLHKNKYLHLDIWSENILYKNNIPILYDYGCSLKLDNNNNAVGLLRGSHLAPEIINKNICIYNINVDIYCLGMTFYELFYQDIFNFHIQDINNYIDYYSTYYKNVIEQLNIENTVISNLIKKMISSDLNKRPSIEIILQILNII